MQIVLTSADMQIPTYFAQKMFQLYPGRAAGSSMCWQNEGGFRNSELVFQTIPQNCKIKNIINKWENQTQRLIIDLFDIWLPQKSVVLHSYPLSMLIFAHKMHGLQVGEVPGVACRIYELEKK